jgi:hypothetical protein
MSFRIRVTDTESREYWLSPGTIFPKLNALGKPVPHDAEFESCEAALAFAQAVRPDFWSSELGEDKIRLVHARLAVLEMKEQYRVAAASYPIDDPNYVWKVDWRRNRPVGEGAEGCQHQAVMLAVMEMIQLAASHSEEFFHAFWLMIQSKCYEDAGWAAAAHYWREMRNAELHNAKAKEKRA